jgi:leader peptidase (prepilin peptidase)/N-methyltransferase
MIRILATGFAGLLGLAFGSFLNVCVSRWPAGESVVTPRSHCRACARTLAWWENVPLLSWIVLRGRCRGCAAQISWRYPLVEAAVGVLWAAAAWEFFTNFAEPGPWTAFHTSYSVVTLLSQCLFFWLMVALAFLDAEHLWLPNLLTLPGTALGFVAFLTASWLRAQDVFAHYGALPLITRFLFQITWHRLVAILAASGMVLLLRWLYGVIRHREGMGLGDVKLMALLGAWLGLPATLLAFLIGTFLGAVAGIAVILFPSKREDPKDWATTRLPFGTFLCVGGIVSSLWGVTIINAYMRWVGL